MKNSKIRSIGYYTEMKNNGVEYALREDGAVFFREKFWNGRFFATTKWTRGQTWDNTFKGAPKAVKVGFAQRGPHYLIETTRLRLPQE